MRTRKKVTRMIPKSIECNSEKLTIMGIQNTNLRDQPAYGLGEAARYLKLPAATLRSWVVGREYAAGERMRTFAPLIKPALKRPPTLSFYNLIEAHVLRSFRTEHGVAIRELRKAIRFAEDSLDIERLLLSKELRTHAGDVFLDKYGQLINLNKSGQLAMRKLLEEHLNRVEWDDWKFPVRLYPYVSPEPTAEKAIVIDPAIAFGRPIVLRARVSTSAIVGRIDAGELVKDIADDYDLTEQEVENAVLYERRAA